MKLPQSTIEAGVAAIIRGLELETGKKFYVTHRPAPATPADSLIVTKWRSGKRV